MIAIHLYIVVVLKRMQLVLSVLLWLFDCKSLTLSTDLWGLFECGFNNYHAYFVFDSSPQPCLSYPF